MAIEVGNIFEGRVTGVKPFGAFVALPEGRVGMVHISEVSNEFVQDIAAVLHDGDTVKVQVINVAPDGKIALSIKRLLPQEPRAPRAPREDRGPRPYGNGPGRAVMAAIAAAGLAAVRAVDARPVRGAVRPGRLLPVCGSPRPLPAATT
ncbi:S1 RNA-binding domain-containing protein [Faecalibacterium sp. OF04-11AC]|uniref:S1 RNA-binding domain-containing protein n=1 Tax=Faecalibacterium sp. OF04-11AC TaxID=2293109 RepID=UPI001FA92EC7|nr:S1 RNA-binding domain-containing protein [Faecalibacterium sp. OF04-11AC]